MRLVLEIERFESIEQFQIHYREWKKKTKKKTQPSRNYDHLAKNYTVSNQLPRDSPTHTVYSSVHAIICERVPITTTILRKAPTHLPDKSSRRP